MNKHSKIFIAGHTGLVGSAILRRLQRDGFENLLIRTHQELNLERQTDVERFFKNEKPEYVILAAARVGGIYANMTYPAQFLYENIIIQSNVIHASFLHGVDKLLFFGSACSYPLKSLQPIKEEYLLSGSIEPTNEPYAIAKIAGMKMCEAYDNQYGTNFISVIPANVYGPYDNFHPDNSHVIPALLLKFHNAKINKKAVVSMWGSGLPRREFLYVDDLADACYFLMKTYNKPEIVNVGAGEEISIRELSKLIQDIVGYEGTIEFDATKPDGILQKLLESSKIRQLGWKVKTSLREGIIKTYDWYLNYSTGTDEQ